jgi:dipeptidyl aminopeptidase/acylaminoacyl peptidase
VKQSEAEEIVAAIRRDGGSAVYVLYPDEGHVLTNPANRIDFICARRALPR